MTKTLLLQSSIKPTCGRIVGFSAGHENLHGVFGVKRGTRCALALWFTLDRARKEWGRILTEQVKELRSLMLYTYPHGTNAVILLHFASIDDSLFRSRRKATTDTNLRT